MIVALVIVCVAAVGWETVRRIGRAQIRTVEGTIVQIDAATRQGAIEVVHPKTGKLLRIEGFVPPDCDIQIDGQPAGLGDLRVGEKARVEGTIHPDLTIIANWVRVSRQDATSASQPAATQPGAAP
jgi:hypothetical protein